MNTPAIMRRGFAAGALCIALSAAQALAQTQVKPGFNVYSAEQDVEIGRQSAAQAERQLPILRDGSVQSYVSDLMSDLATHAPGPRFPYQVKVVNASDINAFALPGGFLYVNRGLIQTARTEGELAGVVAHEIAHIALRHGTHNASKASLTQAGIGVLGGLLGRRSSRGTSQVINIAGGLGLNALFLKYSRDAETQADIVGAQIMAKAGYDPMEMVTFFEYLQRQRRGSPGRFEQFLSSHPAPTNRAARVRQESELIGGGVRRVRSSADFQRTQAELGSMGTAPSMEQIARGQTRTGTTGRRTVARQGRVNVEPPSSRFRTYENQGRLYAMDYPDNWQVYEANNGFGVTIVPEGGVVDAGNGQEAILFGVIVNHYDPFDGQVGQRRMSLDQATRDIVNQVLRTNTHLRSSRSLRRETVDGAPGRSVALSGRSPVTGEEERVTLFTREMGDGHVLYSIFVAPGRHYAQLGDTFSRMVDSLRVDDNAAHRIAN